MKLKHLLLAALCAVMSVSAWAEEGDVTTNVNIDFSNAIVDGAIAGTKGSMTIGSGSGAAARVEGGWLRQGDVTNVVTIPEVERAGSKDVVTVSFKMAWGNKNGMGSSFALKDADGEVICSLSHCRWGASTNTLNVNLGGLVGSAYNNAPILDRNTQFTITIDYAAKTIKTVVSCTNPKASQTFNATLSNLNPVATFETAGFNVGGNTDRADALDDLLITTTEGNYNAATHAYTVKAVCGVVELQALGNGTAGEGEGYAVAGLPYVIEKDGSYYILDDANVSNYAKNFVMGTEDANAAVNYTSDNSIVAFAEAESSTKSADGNYSNGASGIVTAQNFTDRGLALGTLQPGKYRMEVSITANNTRNVALRNSSFASAEGVENKICDATSNGVNAVDFLLYDETPVLVNGKNAYDEARGQYKSNQSADFDYVLIRKIADLPNVGDDMTSSIVNPSFESNLTGWINNGMQTQTNASFDNKQGNVYVEKWQKDGGLPNASVSQTIYAMPNGFYQLSAYAYFGGDGAYIKANTSRKDVTANASKLYSVIGEVTDGTLTIEAGVQGATANWVCFDHFTLTYLGENDAVATMAVNATAKYGTFCAPFAVAVPDGVEASTATINANGATVDLTSVGATIPANTPVILYAEEGLDATTFYGVAEAGTPTAVVLTGVYEDTQAPVGSYVLQLQDNKVGFYQVEGVIPTVGANRCYLTAPSSSANVRAFFFDGETAIKTVETAADNAPMYNVAGVRVNSNYKGIVIKNGKKMMVK